MKRNITLRKSILAIFFGLQILGIIVGKFSDARFFCWAPYDQFSFYEITVRINGRELSDQEISERYRRGKRGRNNRNIHNVISNVRQYEETYATEKNVTVELSYVINGHQNGTWVWPEDKVTSKQ
jgi:hypothetical protein